MNDPRALDDDARAGTVASVVASAMGAKKRDGAVLSAEDIFPRIRAAKPKQGWRAAKMRLGAYFAGVNSYAEAGGKPARAKRGG